MCAKPALNLGWLRALLVFGVFLLALLVAAVANCLARRKLRLVAAGEKGCCPRCGPPARAIVEPTEGAEPAQEHPSS